MKSTHHYLAEREREDLNSLSDGVIGITAARWLGRYPEPHRRLLGSRIRGMLRRGPGSGEDWTGWFSWTDGHQCQGSMYSLLLLAL